MVSLNKKLNKIKLSISKKELDKETALLKIDNLISTEVPNLPNGTKRNTKNNLFRLKKYVKKKL